MSNVALGLMRLGYKPDEDFTVIEKLDGRAALHWHREDAPPTEQEIEAATTQAATAKLRNWLAELRWRAEQAGTTWNAWAVPTNDRSLLKYAAEVAAIHEGVRSDGEPWKFADGFEALTNHQVIAMALAAREHVKACFAAEAAVLAEIEAGRATTPAEVEAAFQVAQR